MSVMIQVRNVPDEMHRQLKARAALAGMTLSDYVREELRKALERPTREELLRRIRGRQPVVPGESPADAVRAERER
jgi:antitoxin FitA